MTQESSFTISDEAAERLARCFGLLIELGRRRTGRLGGHVVDGSVDDNPKPCTAENLMQPDIVQRGRPEGQP